MLRSLGYFAAGLAVAEIAKHATRNEPGMRSVLVTAAALSLVSSGVAFRHGMALGCLDELEELDDTASSRDVIDVDGVWT